MTLERAEAAGQIQKPFSHDPGADLLRELGVRHEQAFLRHLAQTKEVVQIPGEPWEDAVARTVEAIRRGADVVYQATFQDGPWGGRSDFLIRVDKLSALGPFSYEVVETKLARSAKARAILQLCFYSELLARIQGPQPERMHVVLGGGTKLEEFAVQRYSAYFRKVKRDFEEAARVSGSTYPEPVDLCDVCSWFPLCDQRRRDDDHLSLVAGITSMQRKELDARGIDTVARLDAPYRSKDRPHRERGVATYSGPGLYSSQRAKQTTASLRTFRACRGRERARCAALAVARGYLSGLRGRSLRFRYRPGVSDWHRDAA
jgi:predicted RecB family nuclease